MESVVCDDAGGGVGGRGEVQAGTFVKAGERSGFGADCLDRDDIGAAAALLGNADTRRSVVDGAESLA